MQNLDSIFESFIADESLGKIYFVESKTLDKIKINFHTSVRVQMNNKQLPEPKLYITNQIDRFKVFTFKEKNNYFIGISLGAIESLKKFFMFLYSQPYFDSSAGNVTLETEQFLDTTFNVDYKYQYFLNQDQIFKPICPDRTSAAENLFFKAVNYLLLHEYAHITHGHVDYFCKDKLNYMYFENHSIIREKANIEKALEYDADSAASLHSLKDDTLYLLFGDSMFNDHNLRVELKTLNLAVYFLHKLTELQDISISDYEYSTHPFSSQRTASHLALTATVISMIKDKSGINASELVKFSAETIHGIALPAHAKIFREEIIDDGIFYFYSNQGVALTNIIRKAWNIVVDDLQSFTFVNLAPKDDLLNEHGYYDFEEVLKKKRDNNVDSGGEI